MLPRRSSRSLRRALLGAILVLAVPAVALAQTYWTVPQVLKSFFATSTKVGNRRITLPEKKATEIAKKLGVPSIKKDWLVYVGNPEGDRSGYAIVDDEVGMHEPIDYAVQFSPKGVVERVEILVYREPFGDEVRHERFRNQFKGKKPTDPITPGKDIDIISGASISSKSIALGVKRDTLVLEAALSSGSL